MLEPERLMIQLPKITERQIGVQCRCSILGREIGCPRRAKAHHLVNSRPCLLKSKCGGFQLIQEQILTNRGAMWLVSKSKCGVMAEMASHFAFPASSAGVCVS